MDSLRILHNLRHLFQSDVFAVAIRNSQILRYIFPQHISLKSGIAVYGRNRILHTVEPLCLQYILRIGFPQIRVHVQIGIQRNTLLVLHTAVHGGINSPAEQIQWILIIRQHQGKLCGDIAKYSLYRIHLHPRID